MSPFALPKHLMVLATCMAISLPSMATVSPAPGDQQVAREVASRIRYGHYENIRYDAEWSTRAYARFLDLLDPQHLYLLSGDLKDFGLLESDYANVFAEGQLERPFELYNRFQQRVEARLQTLINWLQNDPHFDYTSRERLDTDTDKQPWAITPQALDDIWRKRLKGAALSLRLTEPKLTDEQIAERLSKRYKEQLKHIRQTNHEDVLSIVLAGATSAIDPHTEYMSPSRSESFDIQMRLSLEGIGALLQADEEYVRVASLIPGGPAEKSGQLHPADRIIAVGNDDGSELTSVVGMRLDDVVNRIRGPKGSTVRLQIVPARAVDNTQTRIVTIHRDKVNLEDQAAHSKVVDVNRNGHIEHIGIITVPAFYIDFAAMQAGDTNYRSTTRDVRALIEELKGKQVSGIVLDLRNNGGGALQEANSMVGLFIDRGPTVQVRDARGRITLFTDDQPGMAYTGPLAVLVDRMSASASEIFAGAIQDYGRGLILGGQTFGKGTVQTLLDIDHGGELRMTTAKFYRVSGESTQERGVTPDIFFPNLIDNKDIGESALPNVLPWDVVRPVHYTRYIYPSLQMDTLKRLHEQRIAHEADFLYLGKEADLLKRMRSEKSISLNLIQRKKELETQKGEQLKLENERRQMLKLPLLKELSDDQALSDDSHDTPIDQAQLHEAAEILMDFSTLTGIHTP